MPTLYPPEEDIESCIRCDATAPIDEMAEFRGSFICRDCEGHATACAQCDEDLWYEDATEGDGNFYCDYCHRVVFATCDGCGEGCNRARMREDEDTGRLLCPNCRVRHAHPVLPYCECCCSECCRGAQRANAHPAGSRPRWPNESGSDVRQLGRIRSYSHQPSLTFYGQGPLYLGVEIELIADYPEATAMAAARALGPIAYYKEDGSIEPSGFELVTHPMSYEYAVSGFPWDGWDTLRGEGINVNRSCGMHVHVSRKGFRNSAHIYAWMIAFHRWESEVRKLARRDPSRWGSFQQERRKEFKYHAARKPIPRCGVCYSCNRGYNCDNVQNYGRYSAINILPSETLEVRVFASTTQRQKILGAMGFVHASVEYTRNLNAKAIIDDDAWSWSAFRTWVASKGDFYAPLLAEMERVGCVS